MLKLYSPTSLGTVELARRITTLRAPLLAHPPSSMVPKKRLHPESQKMSSPHRNGA